jgi:hypothetical protein
MQSVNDDGKKKRMFLQQCSEASTEIPGQLVWHTCRYAEFCTMVVSIRITSKEYSTSYQDIMPTMYNCVKVCNHGYTFCSQMRLNLPRMVLPTQGIRSLGHTNILIVTILFAWGLGMEHVGLVWPLVERATCNSLLPCNERLHL